MQIEGIKLILVMNCSVLHFFKFASRMPQIAQILVSTFKISYFSLAIPGSEVYKKSRIFAPSLSQRSQFNHVTAGKLLMHEGLLF